VEGITARSDGWEDRQINVFVRRRPDMPVRDLILEGLEAFCRAHDVVVEQRGRGYSLLNRHSGAPVARLRPTTDAERVQVLW
jgi:hypothetical protein